MKLTQWIKQTGGMERATIKLDIPYPTLNAYCRGYRMPNPHAIVKLHKKSKGQIDFYQIAKTCIEARARSASR